MTRTCDDLRSPEDWAAGEVLVQVATYNERDNLTPLIDAVLGLSDRLQLLVIDDDSPDGTGRMALSAATTRPRLHVLVRRGRRGIGSATLEGYEEARSHGFSICVTLDGDFSHDPTDIHRLLAALDPAGGKPVDLAIGSRRVPGGRTVGWPAGRRLASGLVSLFCRWVLWLPVWDPSSGFRALRLRTLDAIVAPRSSGYAFFEELLLRLHRSGARIVEVPIVFTERARGSSKADWRESLRAMAGLARLTLLAWSPGSRSR
jgi:dolichol-phosphate mannosyltransferase